MLRVKQADRVSASAKSGVPRKHRHHRILRGFDFESIMQPAKAIEHAVEKTG